MRGEKESHNLNLFLIETSILGLPQCHHNFKSGSRHGDFLSPVILIKALPPLIWPFVQTADIEMVVTIVTMLARHITADPSPETLNQCINNTLQEQIY
jgi:hypothetical protein